MNPEPFSFHTSIKLPEFTGAKAGTAAELAEGLRTADDASIFHHTFHFLYEHQYAFRQPSSDFAYWTAEILRDHPLSERLASVNPVECSGLAELRARLLEVLDDHLRSRECGTLAPAGMEFYFMRTNSIVVPTPIAASDPLSFARAVEKVSIGSIYHHMFEAKLWRARNDFSSWLESRFGLEAAAKQIDRLDPFMLTLEQIRRKIHEIILGEGNGALAG